jgi:hypothetical protein
VSEPVGRMSPVRVQNRSDRVWVFGYLRMVPLLLFVGGVVLMVFVLGRGAPVQPEFGIAVIVIVIILPFTLDRTSLLDPVDYVILGDRVRIKRLAGERVWPLDRVVGVELDRPEGEDYDEGQLARRFVHVTLRLRRAWPAPRLLVTESDARAVSEWATSYNIRMLVRVT